MDSTRSLYGCNRIESIYDPYMVDILSLCGSYILQTTEGHNTVTVWFEPYRVIIETTDDPQMVATIERQYMVSIWSLCGRYHTGLFYGHCLVTIRSLYGK